MAKWDAGRFLNTVSYFDAIPIVSELRRWLSSGSERQSTGEGGNVKIVLVVGAASELSELVVRQLAKSGNRVRATIAALSQVPFSVPTNVEYVQVQLDRSDWLTPAIMQDVGAIVVCLDPQSPLAPSVLEQLARTELPSRDRLELFDFTQPTADLQATWGAVDDVVMGGVSESGIRLKDGYASFSGNVSIENSGGFASVRTRNFEPSLNLSNYRGIELRVKGDGQRYKLFVRTEAKWDGIGYASSFDTEPDRWLTIKIPFGDLVPIFRAKTATDAPPIDLSRICSLQLMLSKFEYDNGLNPHFQPGPFELQIESIAIDGGQITPQLVLIAPAQIDQQIVAIVEAGSLPYTIVKAEILEPQIVALITVKSLTQPETVGQILGR